MLLWGVQPELQSWTSPALVGGKGAASSPRVSPALTTLLNQLDLSLSAAPSSTQHILIVIFTSAGKARGARIGCEYENHLW